VTAILTPADLEAITGRKRPRAQILWLGLNGWRFAVSAAGRPVVLQAEAERHLVGGARMPAAAGPRLDLVR
jgi:hypothetical protein